MRALESESWRLSPNHTTQPCVLSEFLHASQLRSFRLKQVLEGLLQKLDLEHVPCLAQCPAHYWWWDL